MPNSGYERISAFSTAFKQRFGTAPSNYLNRGGKKR